MTALNFRFAEDQVIVTADSLARFMHNGTSCESHWLSKIVAVPHAASILCGNGDMRVFGEWVNALMFEAHVKCIDSIHAVSPAILTEINRRQDCCEAALFAFGWSPGESRLAGFRYDTKSQFQGERQEYGIRLMPGYVEQQQHWLQLLAPDWFPGVFDVVKEQRAADLAQKGHQSIGGPLHSAIIYRDSPSVVNLVKHDVFADDGDAFARMRGCW